MSGEIFSWSDFSPELKGIDTKKTAELFDSLRFVRLRLIFVALGCGKTGTLFDPSKPVNIIELHFCAA